MLSFVCLFKMQSSHFVKKYKLLSIVNRQRIPLATIKYSFRTKVLANYRFVERVRGQLLATATSCRSNSLFWFYFSGCFERFGLSNIFDLKLIPCVFSAHNQDVQLGSRTLPLMIFHRILFMLWEAVQLFFRLGLLFILFVPLFFLYPLSMISKGLENLWWKILLLSVHIAGPVFTKFGQWASTRRDILSENTCNYLSTLQRNTKPHSWKCTAEILTQTFGTNWMDFIFLFENNKEPIGSGCVAQVYKAYINLGPLSQCDDKIMETIKKQCNVTSAQIAEQQLTGHPFVDDQPELDERNFSNECLIPVAIKVLHPYIYEQFQRDLWILQALANVIQFLFPRLQWLSFTECLQEFSLYMISQIDLQHEANILEKFNENFKDSSAVYFPRPIRPFVSRDILVETWEEGQPISDFISSSSTVADGLKEELAKLGVETLLKMVFIDNLVHGDLHPGNILVRNVENYQTEKTRFIAEQELALVDICDVVVINIKPKNVSSLRLVILDCGLATSLSQVDFDKLKAVFRAVLLGECEEVADIFLHHSVNTCEDPDKFRASMRQLISSAREVTVSLGKLDVGNLLNEVFKLLITHRVKLESNFVSIILGILVLEGLGRSLNPDLDLLQAAAPYLLSAK